jgi:SAM-dependent methyltransferase
MTDIERELRQSYSHGAAAWAQGPSLVYHLLADALIRCSPIALRDRLVLDLGAGTGVASVVATEHGARVMACDAALGMLLHEFRNRPPAACGDAAQLPFRGDTFDAVIAACVLNHVPDLDGALREVARVTRPGGVVAGSSFSTRQHPAKAAIDAELERAGYEPPPWYAAFKTEREPLTATAERLRDAAVRVGLVDVEAREVDVGLSGLDAEGLAAYRLGMAHVQPFLAGLAIEPRARLLRDAARAAAPTLATPMPLLVLSGRVTG